MNSIRFVLLLAVISVVFYFNNANAKFSNIGVIKISDTLKRHKVPSSIYKIQDNGDDTPTAEEETMRIKKNYNEIKILDTTIIDNKDTLHFHLKFYCLNKEILVIPKFYQSDEHPPKNFKTHPFATKLLLQYNKHIVLNKQFTAADFIHFFKDNFDGNLKRYGSILMPYFSHTSKDKMQIKLNYTIAIPGTDLGTGVWLIISKTGSYKIVEPD